jgi:hypothetical protein
MKTNKKHKYQRSHHVRASAVAIILATAFHLSSVAFHAEEKREQIRAITPSSFGYGRGFATDLERENETARHMVRFDAGLR